MSHLTAAVCKRKATCLIAVRETRGESAWLGLPDHGRLARLPVSHARVIRTYIHNYIHVCIHAYMHTCIHAYMHTCMHTCIHAYMHAAYIHTRTYAYIHTRSSRSEFYRHRYSCLHLHSARARGEGINQLINSSARPMTQWDSPDGPMCHEQC